MPDRFKKFTERARRVLLYAQEEARRFGHDYVGTEHQLLGLIREVDGVAAKALVNLGVELDQVRQAVEYIIAAGPGAPDGEIGLTSRAKRAIECSVDEARRFNHHYVGTEHLLLGLTLVEDGIAARVLTSLGVTLDRARDEIERILSSPPPGGVMRGGPRRVLDALRDVVPGGSGERELKRYNLVIPQDLYREVEELANRQGTTVVEVLRRFIKLGLLATRVTETPGSALIIREGEKEREILLL